MWAAVPATTAVGASRATGLRRRIMLMPSCCSVRSICCERLGHGVHGCFDELVGDAGTLEDDAVRGADSGREGCSPRVFPHQQRRRGVRFEASRRVLDVLLGEDSTDFGVEARERGELFDGVE